MPARKSRLTLAILFAVAVAVEATLFGAFAPADEDAHGGAAPAVEGHGGHQQGASAEGEPLVALAAALTALAGIAFPFFVRTLAEDRAPTRAAGPLPVAAPAWGTDALALLSTSAAVIHFAVVWEHLQEFALFGVLFAVTAVLQLAWAALVLLRPSRPLLLAGALGSAGVAAAWLLSRTAGLPLGPEAWSPEPLGVPDLLATAFEVVIAIGVLVLIRARAARVRLAPRRAAAGTRALAVVLVLLTSVALLAAAGAAF